MTRPSVMWFRRDLRLADHPALLAAASQGPVVPIFVLDPHLLSVAGAPRVAYLFRTLAALDEAIRGCGGQLVVRSGLPEEVVPAVVEECDAEEVHVTADHGPYGRTRDARVEAALDHIPLRRTGSPYAVSPGKVTTASGQPFQVYSAFYRAWRHRGWPDPARNDPACITWQSLPTEPIPAQPPLPKGMALPLAGEAAAHDLWHRYQRGGLRFYDAQRDRPDCDQTSRLSAHLRFGTIHPRTLLADLGSSDERFVKELAWREFYAAVLAAWPNSARQSFQPRMASLEWESGPQADAHFAAWKAGRTGYPLVDAGMRQLAQEGFVQNRVRMVVASFLVKDLHLDWRRGARHFMDLLVDGDLASNQHGWQWTAGTGTDAAPYHRILNPLTQARRFDPEGHYVRRWVPELAGLAPPDIFEPWSASGGPPGGYPTPIVEHAAERIRALELYERAR